MDSTCTWQQEGMLFLSPSSSMQVELARGELSAVQRLLHEVEQLEGYAYHRRWLPVIRAHWWLAQGQLEAASAWAAGVVFPEVTWQGSGCHTENCVNANCK